MALKKSRSRWWSRLHFLVRFAGLTGLLAAGAGVGLAYLKDSLDKVVSKDLQADWEFARSTIQGEAGVDLTTLVAVCLLVGGGLLALLAVLLEIAAILSVVAGRRSAFGFNAVLQIALATALLVGINFFSYEHPFRADWTLKQQFTLPPEIESQLTKLKGDTTIVVYQRHKTFGQLNDKPDAFDYAAERKVVEKVRDLVEQFRALGPRFRVEVLDVEEEGYDEKLKKLTKDFKELREAIENAPENSIFFIADRKVQHLSFNEFYQLDKAASQDQSNLVLLYQGVEPFARKVLNVDEKRPKVGVLVIHEWLTTKGPEEFGLVGLKKSLSDRGFDVRDVILKKWTEFGPPEPGVYTYEESRNEQLEEQLAEANADIKNLKEELANLAKIQEVWKKSLDELNKIYAQELKGRKIDETIRRRQQAVFEQNKVILNAVLKQYQEDRDATAKEKAELNVDTAAEQRRMTDLKAKLDRAIADCDLLILPRMTIRNVLVGDRIPNQLQRIDDAQAAALRDFIKAGKPLLACFGPSSEQSGEEMRFAQLGGSRPDGVERDLAQLGIKLSKQTVLFNVESKSFAERKTGLLSSGAAVEVPPVEFEGSAEPPRSPIKADAHAHKPNPISSSMLIAAHSLGKANLDLRVRYPRPIYYESPAGQVMDFEPAFLATNPASWNEDNPFPTRERVPRYEPPKADDPTKGTADEKRRGPFPIGVAIETQLPGSWFSSDDAHPPSVRLAAIGSGSLFVGKELSAAKEELLLNTCNWLLGRDDLLPTKDREWSYPRVELNEREHDVWHYGTLLVLPGLFAYIGLVVLMVRQLR